MDVIASPRVCRLRLRKDSLRAAGNEYRGKHEKQQEEKKKAEEQDSNASETNSRAKLEALFALGRNEAKIRSSNK